MPKYIDHHEAPQPPPGAMDQAMQMMQKMQADIQARRAGEFGVTPVNVYIGTNGHAWCVTEASSPDAVIKAHAARGVTITPSDITEVSSLA